MDQLRIGRSLRVIRRSRGQRQLDVARAAGVSQTLVSAIERGHGDRLAVSTLSRLFAVLQADLDLVVRYRGGSLDRLLDERHAMTVAAVIAMLRSRGWTTAVEVTFNHYGDRGSIDVLACHRASRTALVVEVKTEIASAEETLRRLDVKARLGGGIARERFGVAIASVVPLLAILDSTANRRRVALLAPLLDPAFPNRSSDVRRWLASPGTAPPAGLPARPGTLVGPAPGARPGTSPGSLLFVAVSRGSSRGAQMSGSHRVRRPRTPAARDP